MSRSKHTPEFRARVSQEYIDGVGSVQFLADKYGIGYSTLRGWIKVYNANRELKDYEPKQEVYLTGGLSLYHDSGFYFCKTYCDSIWIGSRSDWLLCCPCAVCGTLPAFVCVLLPIIRFISGCKQCPVFYLCGNWCLDNSCGNYLSFPGDSRRRLSYDLVEHTFWLGI